MLRDITKPAFILFLVCAICGLTIGFTYFITKDKIVERNKQNVEIMKKEVLNNADKFEKIPISELSLPSNDVDKKAIISEAFKGLKDGKIIGYVFVTESKGYSGNIKITIGIEKNGKINGVKMGDNNETPGLGKKAEEEPFISQFINIIPNETLKVIKSKRSKPNEIEAISGATITSKAVTLAVQLAIDSAMTLNKKGVM